MSETPIQTPIIVIFPHLFIFDNDNKSTGVNIEGLEIKPCFDISVEKESATIRDHLLRIVKLFRLEENRGISEWSYVITTVESKEKWDILRRKLDKFTTVLRYAELSKLITHAYFQHFNYFIFQITREQENKDYYDGILNGQTSFNFDIDDESKVNQPYSPPVRLEPLLLTTTQINENEYTKFFYGLYAHTISEDELKKLLRSMEWFNRSFANIGEVDLSDAVIFIETAFESLFKTPSDGKGIKAQVKSSIFNLLGETKQINDWVDKFWGLRNSLVHGDIELPSFYYIATRGTKGHIHHLNIARKIFVRCLDAIIKIRQDIYTDDIHTALVSNEVRIKDAIKIIDQANGNLQISKDAFKLISNLRSNELSASKPDTVTLGKILLPLVISDLQSIQIEEKDNIITSLQAVLNWKEKEYRDLALLYSKAHKLYKPFYLDFDKSLSNYTQSEQLKLRGAAYHFLGFATWRLLTFFYND